MQRIVVVFEQLDLVHVLLDGIWIARLFNVVRLLAIL